MRGEIKLSSRLKKSNRERFNNLVAPLERKIWAYAYGLTKDPEEADDLLQETLLKAYRFIHKFDGNNIRGWLTTICKNNYINDFRKIKKLPGFVDYTDFVQCEEHPLLEREEGFGDEVVIALDQVDAIYKTCFILSRMEGYQYEEISKIYDIPVGTVRSRIHRARTILKKELA